MSGEARFRQLDASGDGVLTMDEATPGTRSFLERIFKEAGKQPGDRLTREEFLATQERLRGKSTSGPTRRSSATESAAEDDKSPPKGLGFIDANGDGSISRTEWSKFTQAFSRLDADKDNSLSSTELEVIGGAAELLVQLADANGDGKIARVEWAKLVHSFARLDANRDSSLDSAELEKVAEATVAAASGSASLSSGKSAKSGPTRWRGSIEGRGEIELVVEGNHIVGRELGGRGAGGGGGGNLGAGTFTMTGDGKSGNMDAVYTEGDRSGQVCLGIYKLTGDTLIWCVNNRGGRPQSFSGGGGSWMLTLNRVSDEPPSGSALQQ
jgi:uncharacterized protein (TIGR03067 family)